MKKIFLFAAAAALIATGCKKEEAASSTTDFQILKREVLTDFTNNIALASYKDLHDAAATLHTSVTALAATPSATTLAKAQKDWKDMRAIWEQCEGFLFGPVDVNEYDPHMDTWPTDYAQIDSLLTSTTTLGVSNIQTAQLSLRGYHPMEYLLFGKGGSRQPSELDARKREYLSSLAADLQATCAALYSDWTGGYAQQVINAGTAQSTAFSKMQNAYLDIVDGMIGICEEVGEGKIYEPFIARDTQAVESPYSGNSWADFEANLRGLQNVYLGRYKTDGKGLNDLVAAKNKSLDASIQAKINAAISSFATVKSVPFEKGILDAGERSKIQSVMDVLATLKTTLEDDLRPFVIQYITD